MKTLIFSLFPKEALFNTIDTTQLLEFQSSKQGEWLKYLPTVEMTYTLDGKPRPTIFLSSTLLYRAKKD